MQNNHGLNGLNGLAGAAKILRPEGAKGGDSLFESVAFSLRECGVAMQCIRVIRNQYGICAQPKIREIREIRGRKKIRSIRTIRCSKKIRG